MFVRIEFLNMIPRETMRKPAIYVFSPVTVTTVAGKKMTVERDCINNAGEIKGLVKGRCTRR